MEAEAQGIELSDAESNEGGNDEPSEEDDEEEDDDEDEEEEEEEEEEDDDDDEEEEKDIVEVKAVDGNDARPADLIEEEAMIYGDIPLPANSNKGIRAFRDSLPVPEYVLIWYWAFLYYDYYYYY